MKIREGAYYRTRGGDVVGPMRRTPNQSWYSNYLTWNEESGIFSSGTAYGRDLISEVYISDTPFEAADALETQAAEITRLRAANCRRHPRRSEEGEVMDWQPIETAPRDNTWFVIINADDPDSVEVGRYNPLKLHRYEDAGNGLFRKVAYIGCEWDGFNNFHNATHWRPAFDKLPDPAPPEDREP